MKKQVWVYKGVCEGKNQRKLALFEILNGETLTGVDRLFADGKYTRRCSIGGIYTVEADTKQAKLHTLEYQSDWDNERDLLEWRLKSDKEETIMRIGKLEKQSRKKDIIGDALKPICEIYRETDMHGKRAIETIVLAALRGFIK